MRLRVIFMVGILVFMASSIFLLTPQAVCAALSVLDVVPDFIPNDIGATITITGTDFTTNSQARIGDVLLTTSYISSTTITAVVPPGLSPGVYDIHVDIPSSGTASLAAGLTILAPTSTPQPFSRPQIVIDSYSISVGSITFGQDVTLFISLDNAGGSTAYGLQVTFLSMDLLMLKNGGVAAVGSLGAVGKAEISQTMTVSASLVGKSYVSVQMDVAYYDALGSPFSEKFTIYLPVTSSGGGETLPLHTPTHTGVRHSQLVITNYSSDIIPLQPGLIFSLELSIQNVGSIGAKSISMIVGGGSSSGGGTPQSGVAAGGGEFSNFAPVGTSNVQLLGNLDSGSSMVASQQMIVNVNTNPGAYPMKISLVYLDETGNVINDEQVITLLVYRLPQVEIGFYQSVGEFYVGQVGLLPIQVVNLGRNTVVLGMMTVETTQGIIENGQQLVGALDMGGYFPLDATLFPEASGPLDLTITIGYTDDFNQPRTISQSLSVEVFDVYIEPTPDPNIPIDPIGPGSSETFWQKLWRFILGLFGLDSSPTAPDEYPFEEQITPFPVEPLPSGGKG